MASRYNHLNPNLTLTHPENGFLQLFTDYGLLAGLFFGVALTVLVSGMLWMGVSRHDMLGPVIGVIAVCIQNLADFSLSVPGVACPVVASLALMDGQTVVDGKSREPRNPQTSGRWVEFDWCHNGRICGAYSTFSDSVGVDEIQQIAPRGRGRRGRNTCGNDGGGCSD